MLTLPPSSLNYSPMYPSQEVLNWGSISQNLSLNDYLPESSKYFTCNLLNNVEIQWIPQLIKQDKQICNLPFSANFISLGQL